MQSVHLIGDYGEGTYTIQNDKSERYNLPCSTAATPAEAELTRRRVAVKPAQVVKVEEGESEDKTEDDMSSENKQVDLEFTDGDLYEADLKN